MQMDLFKNSPAFALIKNHWKYLEKGCIGLIGLYRGMPFKVLFQIWVLFLFVFGVLLQCSQLFFISFTFQHLYSFLMFQISIRSGMSSLCRVQHGPVDGGSRPKTKLVGSELNRKCWGEFRLKLQVSSNCDWVCN